MEQEWITNSQTRGAQIKFDHIILKLMCPNDHRLIRFISSVDERQTNQRLQHSLHRVLTMKPPLHLPSIPWNPNLYHRHVQQLLHVYPGSALFEAVVEWSSTYWELEHSYFLWKQIWSQTRYTKKTCSTKKPLFVNQLKSWLFRSYQISNIFCFFFF